MKPGILNRIFSGEKSHQALLLMLLCVILAGPLVQNFRTVNWLMSFMFILVLLAAVRTMAHSLVHLWTASVLAAIAIAGQIGVLVDTAPWLQYCRDLSSALFLFTVCLALLRNIVLRSQKITQDLIYGAVNVYLMVGVAFAFLYADLALAMPGSFHGLEQHSYGPYNIEPFVYFSYVTLSTLGYGDITPASHLSMTMAYLEAIFGQLFLAILVARLVGLYIADSRASR
jgi:hypothetical protein